MMSEIVSNIFGFFSQHFHYFYATFRHRLLAVYLPQLVAKCHRPHQHNRLAQHIFKMFNYKFGL